MVCGHAVTGHAAAAICAGRVACRRGVFPRVAVSRRHSCRGEKMSGVMSGLSGRNYGNSSRPASAVLICWVDFDGLRTGRPLRADRRKDVDGRRQKRVTPSKVIRNDGGGSGQNRAASPQATAAARGDVCGSRAIGTKIV